MSKKTVLSQLTIFSNSSRMPFWVERGALMRRVGRFLARAERRQ